MDVTKLNAMVEHVIAHGPTRVVVDEEGSATTPERALEQYRVEPDVVFVRNDGWSLGAPKEFQDVAKKMWEDKWVAFMWIRESDGEDWLSCAWEDRPRKTRVE